MESQNTSTLAYEIKCFNEQNEEISHTECFEISPSKDIIPGFLDQITNMKPSDTKDFTLNPDQAYGMRGQAPFILGNSKLNFHVRCFKPKPKASTLTSTEKEAMFEEIKQEAKTFFIKQDFDVAVKHYREAMDYTLDGDDGKEQRLMLWNNVATCFYKQGLWKRVIRETAKASEAQLGNAKTWKLRAESTFKLEQWQDCNKECVRAIKAAPGDKDLRELLDKVKSKL